jgi:hypothetical protein
MTGAFDSHNCDSRCDMGSDLLGSAKNASGQGVEAERSFGASSVFPAVRGTPQLAISMIVVAEPRIGAHRKSEKINVAGLGHRLVIEWTAELPPTRRAALTR